VTPLPLRLGLLGLLGFPGLQETSPVEPSAWEHFPAFVWRAPRPETPLDPGLVAAFGGANVERDDPAEQVLTEGLDFYVGHAPGRNTLHLERDSGAYLERWQEWLETRDSRLLVREPCLTDPATREHLFDQLDRTLAARAGRHGVGLSLGDELSLTPWGDPVDLCRSPTCEAAWARHLEGLGREVAFPDTDGARRALTSDDTTPIGPWLERRRFNHALTLGWVDELAERARRLAPGTPVGVLGLAGRTAFGGLSIPDALEIVDFIEPYATTLSRELCYTLRRPEQHVLWTLLVDRTSAVECRRQVWEHALRGGDGVVLYRERFLLDEPAKATATAEAVAAIRSLRAADWPAPARRPRTRGVALVSSDDSIALAFLRDAALEGESWPHRLAGYQEQRGTFETSARSWREAAETVGVLPGAVPIERVDEALLPRFPLLVLLHVAVLSDRDLAGLERYLASGGRAVVDGDFGSFFPDGTRRSPTAFERLSGRHRGRLYERVRNEVSQLSGLLSGVATGRAPQIVRATVPTEVLRFETRLDDGDWWIAYLPRSGTVSVRWHTPGARAGRVQWLHPAGAEEGPVTTAPGEPVIFRLRP